jgi:hypothetical protein
MTSTLITPEGEIAARSAKPDPFAPQPKAGWRRLPDPGPPADLDHEIETCTAIEPVPADAAAVGYLRAWKDLDTVKAVCRARINTTRDDKEAGVFPYLGHDFDCDPRSVQRINTAVQAAQAALAAGAPFAVEWTAADNVAVAMTAQDLMGMPVALAQYANTLHVTAKTLKAQIDAAATVEAVVAIGWPD